MSRKISFPYEREEVQHMKCSKERVRAYGEPQVYLFAVGEDWSLWANESVR